MSTGGDRDRTDRVRDWSDEAADRRTAERLRRALAAEAQRVTPSADGLHRIRARTAPTARRSTWLLPLAAAAASVAVIGGIGWTISQGTVDTPSAAEGTVAGEPDAGDPVGGTAASGPTSLEPEGTPFALPVYYVGAVGGGDQGADYRLFREFHPTTTAQTPDAQTRVELALREMLAGVADDPDYREAVWPVGLDVAAVDIDESSRLITVDLAGAEAAELSAAPSDARGPLSVQQLVFTATAAASVGSGSTDEPFGVQLLLGGERVDHVLGTPAAAPLQRDTAGSRAAVWILSVDEGETLANPLTVSGEANLPEDGVGRWEVARDGAVVVADDVRTAGCCSWRPFSVELDDTTLTPGAYELRVLDATSTVVDTKAFNVEGPAS